MEEAMRVGYRHFQAWALVLAVLGAPTLAEAASDLILKLAPPAGSEPGAGGTATVKSHPRSADDLKIVVVGLEPNMTHSVLLAPGPETGSAPVRLAGEFTTDSLGQAFFSANIEVVDAYAPSSPNVPLDFIRIQSGSAAGLTEISTGEEPSPTGRHVLSTVRPIPSGNPSVAAASTRRAELSR